MAAPRRRWQPTTPRERPARIAGIILAVIVAVVVLVWLNLRVGHREETWPRVVQAGPDAQVNHQPPPATRIQGGAEILSGSNRLRLEWDDHSILDLGAGSAAVLVGDAGKHLRVTRGTIGMWVTPASGQNPGTIELPGGTLMVTDGRFTAAIDPDRPRTHVRVLQGQATVAGAHPQTLVAPAEVELEDQGKAGR